MINSGKQVCDFCTEDTRLVDQTRVVVSPTGKYRLVIDYFTTCDAESKRRTWNYTRGQIFQGESGQPLATVHRNYSSFWHCWAQCDQGNEYLFCGENYQGISRVDCQTGEVLHSLPKEAGSGWGWCHACMEQSPSGKYLMASGCYWGAPYDTRIYHFDPQVFPPQIHAYLMDVQDTQGWGANDDTLILHKDWEGVQVNGVFYLDTHVVRSGQVSPKHLEEMGWGVLSPEQSRHYQDQGSTYWSWRNANIVWNIGELQESITHGNDNWEEKLPHVTTLPEPSENDLENIEDPDLWTQRFLELAKENPHLYAGGCVFVLTDDDDGSPDARLRVTLLSAMEGHPGLCRHPQVVKALEELSLYEDHEVAVKATQLLKGSYDVG